MDQNMNYDWLKLINSQRTKIHGKMCGESQVEG